MAEQSKNVIKRTYDQYLSSDALYGQQSSTTLNPVREIKFDQIEIIRRRLQQVTDDIVRRRIVREPEPDRPIPVSLSPGALPERNSMLRQAAQINTGSIGLFNLFPIIDGPNNGIQNLLEPIIGTFPTPLIVELDGPLALDCEEILKQYDFAEDEGNGGDDEEDEGESDGSDKPDIPDEGSEDEQLEAADDAIEDEENQEDIDEANEFIACAMIELTWLKIILIILRIIKILQILMDLILAILVPLLEIVMLALICWLVPPAAEQLRQRITEMIIALVVMIITRLIQMIFNLLNLDCICDQTMDIIAQIKQAMSAFSALMSVFKVDTVNMMAKNAAQQLQDPLDKIQEMFNLKMEAMSKIKEEWYPLDIKDMWNRSKEQFKNGVMAGISEDPNINKLNQTAQAAYNLIKDDTVNLIRDIKNLTKLAEKPPPLPEVGAASGGISSSLTSQLKSFDVTME